MEKSSRNKPAIDENRSEIVSEIDQFFHISGGLGRGFGRLLGGFGLPWSDE